MGLHNLIEVAEIYPTFNGEQNSYGIGSPTIFLRLGGCHLRCYMKTKGVLCDTPKFLAYNEDRKRTFESVLSELNKIRDNTGIELICLSGGDPLARPIQEVKYLLKELLREGFKVTVETSGTIPTSPFNNLKAVNDLSFIVDYKTPSSGINDKICKVLDECSAYTPYDYIKFVIDGEEDYEFFKTKLDLLYGNTKAVICVGSLWNSAISPQELVNKLIEDNLMGKVTLNFQVHKLILASDFSKNTDSVQI